MSITTEHNQTHSSPAELGDDMLEASPLDGAESNHTKDFDYGFAKRNGIILSTVDDANSDTPTIFYKAGISIDTVNEVYRYLGDNIALEETDDSNFEKLLAQKYNLEGSGARAMMDDLGDELDLHDVAESLPEPKDLLESDDDAPIIRLINAIFTQAIKEGASDVHIETFEKRLIVRMRVDGVLKEVIEPPRSLAPVIISRLKVMSKLDISEKRVPQDGRIALQVAGRSVDIRVSTLPSGNSERIVLRILDKNAGRLRLDALNMDAGIDADLKELIQRPHGIILVTGPTGSGKTTTLYAALTELNETTRNILTVEDPIEYYIDGIGQTQVNNKVDMTFARGLRAILRQDPDVVMIGEIRDLETAEIAVQASLTGHLVFSTLHTNTAVGAITRLRDMGIEPFLLSSSLLAVMSQRLVRTLCPHCKEAHEADNEEKRKCGIDASQTRLLYRPKGCAECSHSGYKGRKGIYELIRLDDETRSMIHENASEMDIVKHVRNKSLSLRQVGIQSVLDGETSLEEVLRVTAEDPKQ